MGQQWREKKQRGRHTLKQEVGEKGLLLVSLRRDGKRKTHPTELFLCHKVS